MRKIDIHCHTTNRIVNDVICTEPTLYNISVLMKKHDIEHTVLLASYFPHKQSGISNFRLQHWVQEWERQSDDFDFLIYGSFDFEFYFRQGMNELEELAKYYDLAGIKIYTCYQNIDLSSEKFHQVIAFAESFSLPVMFHTGVSYASHRKYKKKSVAKLYTAKDLSEVANMYPNVNFIFSHLSKPNFDEMVEASKSFSNVYSDVSGLIDSKYHADEIPVCIENVKVFVNECGPEKLLFGTDFPVQSHEHSILFVEEGMKEFSSDDRQKVYYDNAFKLLGLI